MDQFKKLLKRSYRRTRVAGFSILEAYQSAVFARQLAKVDVPQFSFLLVTMVRDEALRLPYFFEYYKKFGVDRFLVLDHQSTDKTAEVIAAEPDAVRVEIEGNFAFKRAWLQTAVSHLAKDRWCLVLDADEFIVWHGTETGSLKQLTDELDSEGAEAFACSLIDMYPESDVSQVGYCAGDNPLEYAPFFDKLGDTREKMFGVSPLLTKVPLMRLRQGHYLTKGQHNVRNAVRSVRSGALLHFKFLQDFKGKIRTNPMIKKVDPQYNRELEAYKEKFDEGEDLILYNENSVRYQNFSQLLELGFAKY